MGFLRGRVWFPLWSNVITLARNRVNDRDRDVSTEEKARVFFSLMRLPASTEKDMFILLTAYGMWVPWQTIDMWSIGFWSLFYPTDTRNTDRLTQESLWQKTVHFRKSLHVQRRVVVRGGGVERQGLVCFLEPRDFDDPGSEDLINKEWFWTSGTRRARGMSKDSSGIHTRPIKCEHTVTHHCFIDYSLPERTNAKF